MEVILDWVKNWDLNDYLSMILTVCVAITLYLYFVDRRIRLNGNKKMKS